MVNNLCTMLYDTEKKTISLLNGLKIRFYNMWNFKRTVRGHQGIKRENYPFICL